MNWGPARAAMTAADAVRAAVTVQIASAAATVPTAQEFTRWVEHALRGQRAYAELTIRIVDEAEGRGLNRHWRQRDYATNVLSFPLPGVEAIAPDLLGDIVICAPVVFAEARAQGKSAAAHWAHLTVHAVLHLLGYTHADDPAAAVMEQRERLILADLGFADPYPA